MPFDLDHKNNPTHNPNQKYITQLSMLMVASLMTLPALAHPGHDAHNCWLGIYVRGVASVWRT